MQLKSIKLTNFRNYSKANFNFTTLVTILIGDNAQGKSNFLESIYLLATTKSLKADKDLELIKEREDFLRVEGEVVESVKLEIGMQLVGEQLNKKIKVNGIPRRLVDYAKNLAVVVFAPEDINLVTGAPSLRRYYLDSVLSQVDPSYKKALASYESMVVRKNKLLKRIREGFANLSELDYWSDQQVLLGTLILNKREHFFQFINGTEKKFGQFEYQYLASLVSTERLKEYQSKEIEAASSLIGPHRDDFLFMFQDKDLAKYGSRGEQRTAVLDLKLAEVNFMESVLETRPILLLDDIFSELDLKHRQHVVEVAALQQTMIATVEFDNYLKKAFKNASLFSVENGQLTLIDNKLAARFQQKKD